MRWIFDYRSGIAKTCLFVEQPNGGIPLVVWTTAKMTWTLKLLGCNKTLLISVISSISEGKREMYEWKMDEHCTHTKGLVWIEG